MLGTRHSVVTDAIIISNSLSANLQSVSVSLQTVAGSVKTYLLALWILFRSIEMHPFVSLLLPLMTEDKLLCAVVLTSVFQVIFSLTYLLTCVTQLMMICLQVR